MSEIKIWQGKHDMLCGIYCAAHLIACYKVANNNPKNQSEFYLSETEAAFYALMRSVERLKWLTAKRVCESRPKKGGGFKDTEMEKIFNGLNAKECENLTAIAFSRAKISKLRGSKKRSILRRGASAIVNEPGELHWITAEGIHRDGGYCCFDPSLDYPKRRLSKISWDKGLLITEPKHWISS